MVLERYPRLTPELSSTEVNMQDLTERVRAEYALMAPGEVLEKPKAKGKATKEPKEPKQLEE